MGRGLGALPASSPVVARSAISPSTSWKSAGLAEVAIDRGKAHVGDGIEALQRLHHQLADTEDGIFQFAHAFELAHDARYHAVDALGLDRALAQRDLDGSGRASPGRTARAGPSA
jgi:hypothetical protein